MQNQCMSLGSRRQKDELNKLIKKSKKENLTIVQELRVVQQIYGYLPQSVINYLAKELNKPASEIYSVATFYAEFSLSPKGKYPISVCLGTACYVNGAEQIYNKVCQLLNITEGECTQDGTFSIDQTRCIGCCGLAPVLTIGKDVYGNVKINEVENILNKYMEKQKWYI